MNIMKFRPLFYLLSALLISFSLFAIFRWGFQTSVDFSGGSVWEIVMPSGTSQSQIQDIFNSSNVKLSSVSQNGQTFQLKFENVTQEQKNALETQLKTSDAAYQENRFETLGPILGKELLQKTIFAIILSSLSLLLFIGRRFKDFSFGASAVLAMFHDALILVGSFAILGHFFGAELDALFVTALLTTLSASVHDTVVTFDRIRELKRQYYQLDWVELANTAVSETIVRSINNSMTIIFMLLALVLLGGDTTRWFAVALLIGAVCGTYSSFGVAIPLVLFWKKSKRA
jgi:preprotein translocase subunit SecF